MKWSKKLSVGIPEIDEQHKKLIKLSNELLQIVKAKEDDKNLLKAFILVLNFSKTHFRNEERLLEKVDYPALDEHKELHEEFIEKIKQYEHDIRTGKSFIATEAVNYIQSWLLDHILSEDKAYTPYLKES